MYSLVLPACTVPDEDRHFARAYKMSNYILNGTSLAEQNEKMYMRTDIIDSLSRDYDVEKWIEYYKSFFEAGNEESTYLDNPDVISQSPPYYQYIYPGLVISICRSLNVGASMLLFIGREFNLFLFSGLIYLSLRILPQMMPSITLLSLFPMTLVLATSFSYDSIIISTLVLFFVLLIKCIKGHEMVSLSDLIILSLLFAFTIPIKIVYFPAILLFFCIKKDRFPKPRHKIIWISLVCIITSFIIAHSHGDTIRYLFDPQFSHAIVNDSQTSTPESIDISEHIWTVNDAKSKPLEFIGIMFRSLFNTSNQLFMNISGYYFGWFSYQIPITIACIFPLLFAIAARSDTYYGFGRKERSIVLVVIVSSFFLSMLSMLLAETPYGFNTVRGVQGRYFLPLMPLVALMFNRKNDSNELSRSRLITISTIMNSVVVLYLLNDILFE